MQESNLYVIKTEEEAEEFLNFLRKKDKQEKEIKVIKKYSRLRRSENDVVNEDLHGIASDHNYFPYSGQEVVEKIIDYAYSLDELDYDNAQAIELMLLALFARGCSDKTFKRICNISKNAKKNSTKYATYNFKKGAKTNIYNEFKK